MRRGSDSSCDVAIVAGTRPEVIKLMPVLRALEGAGIGCRLLLTGQHRELLASSLAELDLDAAA